MKLCPYKFPLLLCLSSKSHIMSFVTTEDFLWILFQSCLYSHRWKIRSQTPSVTAQTPSLLLACAICPWPFIEAMKRPGLHSRTIKPPTSTELTPSDGQINATASVWEAHTAAFCIATKPPSSFETLRLSGNIFYLFLCYWHSFFICSECFAEGLLKKKKEEEKLKNCGNVCFPWQSLYLPPI